MPVAALVGLLALAVLNVNELPEIAGTSAVLRALGSVPGVGSLLQVGVPVQVPLVIATAVAAGVAWRLRWNRSRAALQTEIPHEL